MLFFCRRNREEEQQDAYEARDVSREFRLSGARGQGLTFYADCISPALYFRARLYRACGARWRRAAVFTPSSRFWQRERPAAGSAREPGDSFVNARVYTRHTRRSRILARVRTRRDVRWHARARERGTNTRTGVKCHAIDSSESAIAPLVPVPAARWRGARARPKDGRRTGT